MTLGSLFDGIGGFPLSGLGFGITPAWASEIDPFPIKVTQIRFPNMQHVGDITKLNGAELEPVDIITGGSPCQDLSVAGKRAGLEGARSGLFMEQIRIIKEARAKFGKPRFMVWENVPGAFSSAGGEDFRAVIEETARIAENGVSIPRPADGKWPTAGAVMGDTWSIAWRVLDAQFWGVPQRRRRIFLVADFGGQSAPEILFKSESVSGNTAESGTQGEGAAEGAERGAGAAGFKLGNSADARSIGWQYECSPTLSSESGGNKPAVMAAEAGGNQPAVYAWKKVGGALAGGSETLALASPLAVRRLTPLECERLQGFPDGWTDIEKATDSARYKALGNSVAIPCVKFVLQGIAEELREAGE